MNHNVLVFEKQTQSGYHHTLGGWRGSCVIHVLYDSIQFKKNNCEPSAMLKQSSVLCQLREKDLLAI